MRPSETSPTPPSEKPPGAGSRPLLRGWVPVACLLGVGVLWFGVQGRVRDWVYGRALLANDAPTAESLEEYFALARGPGGAEPGLVAAWESGRIVHREAVVRWVAAHAGPQGVVSDRVRDILFAGIGDPDLGVREAALGALATLGHPGLPAAGVAQLSDPDPEVRRLGLEVLRRHAPGRQLQRVVALVRDPQPEVAAMAIHVVGRHAGVDFGVRLSDAVPPVGAGSSGGPGLSEEKQEKLRVAARRVEAWWESEGRQRPWPAVAPLPDTGMARRQVPAGDFLLPDLEGRLVRLSEFRGRPVLIQFWATWCTACLAEIPALVELHRRHGTRLAILGISLDGVSDGHGHGDGDEEGTVEDRGETGTGDDRIQGRVAGFVKRRGVPYPILLDSRNEVGARFNGGELPTTIWVDRDGFVRRRFVGARPLPVLEAMLAEVEAPAPGNPGPVGAR